MYAIELPLKIVEIKLLGPQQRVLSFCLGELNTLGLDMPNKLLAESFSQVYQSQALAKGRLGSLFRYWFRGDFSQSQIKIELRGKLKYQGFKRLEIPFDYLVEKQERGYRCFIPAILGETFVGLNENETEEAREQRIAQAVQELILIDFARHKRSEKVQNLLALMWFQGLELKVQNIELQIPEVQDFEQEEENEKKKLLPKVAEILAPKQQALFGMQQDFQRLSEMVLGKYRRSVLLIGRSGLGKSSLIEELAYQRNKLQLQDQIWETTAAKLIKELSGDIGWQENLSQLCRELSESGDFLFVRNFAELFEVGQYQGNEISIGAFLRDFLARGEINLLSECTEEELALIELKQPHYLEHLQRLRLEEPKAEFISIIKAKMQQLSQNLNQGIETSAIETLLSLQQRYLPYAGFPGKTIRVLEGIMLSQKERDKAIDRQIVLDAFAQEAGMPRFMIDPQIPMDTQAVRAFFQGRLFGQSLAIERLMGILTTLKTGMLREGKPIASLLFLGPTGVGKTQLAKILAQFMFGQAERMVRFDMSEYASAYALSRLTGLGNESDGLLTGAVRREPFCVLLFDELEKAHPLFNDLLLQILGEGRLTDSRGRIVNFCSTIIIMTSNIGAQRLQMGQLGWTRPDKQTELLAEYFEEAARKFFRPEIFNRIDQIIPFHHLSPEVIKSIVHQALEALKLRSGIHHRSLDLKISSEVYAHLAKVGYDERYGARALQRSLQDLLIAPLARQINLYPTQEPLEVSVSLGQGDKIQIETKADPLRIEWIIERLTQAEYMDFASELRRDLRKLGESTSMLQLRDLKRELEQEAKANEDGFWRPNEESKKSKGDEYSLILSLLERYQQAKGQIELMERQMALMSLNLQSLQTQIYKELETWYKSFFSFKVELLDQIYPNYHFGQVLIYATGVEAQSLLRLYEDLAQEQGFEAEPRALIEEGGMVSSLPLSEEVVTSWAEVLEAGQRCLGLALRTKGPLAKIWFETEAGWHTWQDREGRDLLLEIVVSEPTEFEPEQFNQRFKLLQAQRPRPRRLINWEGKLIEDQWFKPKGIEEDLNEWLAKHLKQQFQARVNQLTEG